MFPFFRPLLLATLLGLPAAGRALDCPALPAAPAADTAAAPALAPPYSVYEAAGGSYEAPLGIGRLHVPEDGPQAYDWLQHVRLPLWQQPDAAPFLGWLVQGRLATAKPGSVPLTGAGLVETSYEQSSFIVWEQRGSGWLRLRLAPGQEAWTHSCHLAHGAALRFQPWEDFLQGHGDWLHFRGEGPQLLRAAPDATARVVARSGGDDKLTWLERRGDWLRVRLQQPDTSCSEPDARSTVHEGWVKWRDDKMGPRLWIYTRGC